ncbi:MAG: putative signal transduction histidine kinase [Bacteroidota bacterium]|nr:putative signal transduction histidine kinase [Bacteroidota bacterium]
MKLSQEHRIALYLVTGIYTFFTIIRIIFFPEQTVLWHVELGLIGLFFLVVMGFIVWAIDVYLNKKYPFERNIITRIFLQFILTLTVLLTMRLISAPLILKLIPFKISNELLYASVAVNIFMVLSLILSIFGYHFFKRWKEEKIVAAELGREKVLVQYDNLKNQLNPHFLFNSLTSLNSLIFENPQLASDFLQQLSKVYRYVLDNKEKNLVVIETEINFVKHYVQLLKARFENGLDVLFEVEPGIQQKGIVPVTLQILIENAIKHNVTQRDSPLLIRVYNEAQYLVVENNFQKKNIVDSSNGQGLDNLKNLYHYLTEEKVLIEESTKSFKVKIPLLEL